MFSYLPHTEQDVADMLKEIGITSIDELFSDIPPDLLLSKPLNMPSRRSEQEVSRVLSGLAETNRSEMVSFLGCGIYDHLIPSVVKHIISRSEFSTAYTPYQPEFSQGLLQAIFEFQTLICELTSLDVSNASLYDGHTAAVEAANIAVNSVKKADTILYSATLHPHTKQVLHTHFSGSGISLVEVKQENGAISTDDLKQKLTATVAVLITQTPNFFGCLEDYTGITNMVHENKSLLAVSSNPLSLGMLRSQGEWGADIGFGDTQVFGLHPSFGGPSAGYIAAQQDFMRKMPGRIVGQSVDKDGKRAFLLTLQAREQHIKRERATSNICSNQALAALATTVHLAALGKEGLKEAAAQNYQKAHYLYERLISELPVRSLYNQPFFNEFSLVLDKDPETVLAAMEKDGILGGIALKAFYPDAFPNALIVAVTEKRTREELDRYVEVLRKVLK
ncbi:MAG: glycine dehydrogenase (aminomethyl-transferring) [Nitrospirae bacterium GWC2_57_13]|jgi:glycine dehydrogenase subunit 1|nr:MAG: glycine dehydrogenase (aminomethyl-transferring) [Nitrospirae bacterium GWC2_57_13]HAS53306.1 aminomethyl-transferring glycine dehydrogenase subunit GcvPA [Nitrospiraceae bacterium]